MSASQRLEDQVPKEAEHDVPEARDARRPGNARRPRLDESGHLLEGTAESAVVDGTYLLPLGALSGLKSPYLKRENHISTGAAA